MSPSGSFKENKDDDMWFRLHILLVSDLELVLEPDLELLDSVCAAASSAGEF